VGLDFALTGVGALSEFYVKLLLYILKCTLFTICALLKGVALIKPISGLRVTSNYNSFQKGNWAIFTPRNEFEQAQCLVDKGLLK